MTMLRLSMALSSWLCAGIIYNEYLAFKALSSLHSSACSTRISRAWFNLGVCVASLWAPRAIYLMFCLCSSAEEAGVGDTPSQEDQAAGDAAKGTVTGACSFYS